jgi:hypothetical protein
LDIKLSNIFLTKERKVKLGDFEIVRIVKKDAEEFDGNILS